MALYKSSIFLILCLCFKISSAQYAEKIVSGRPGQANGPFSVGKGIYQIQSGLDFNNVKSDFGSEIATSYSINQNSVFRIGLFEHSEFRFAYGYQIKDELSSNLNEFIEELSGFNALQLGFRQNLMKQKSIIPAIGIQLTAKFGGFDRYEREQYNYEAKLLLQHHINEALTLNTNISAEYNDQQNNTLGRYVLSFGYSLTEKIGLVAEAYGTFNENNTDILFDAGISYLLSPNFQLDAYTGYGSNKIAGESPTIESYFISLGFSYRINTRD